MSTRLLSLVSQDPALQLDQDDSLNPALRNYLMGWTLVAQKYSSQAYLQHDDERQNRLNSLQKKSLSLLFDSRPESYLTFIQKAFDTLTLLDLGTEQQLAKQIGKLDFTAWLEGEGEGDEMARMVLKALFEFAAVFPLFMRKWMQQAHKQEVKQAEGVLKGFISSAIFNREVQHIELRQQEWKSKEFNIYVTPQTKEIVCVYEKEDCKIEISVHVPNNYPLQLIHEIDYKRGLHLSEAKIKRFILMMRSLLAQENNSLLSCLLLWKANIDNEFKGVEECYICFCIVHAKTNQLPKKACKTCKHKFHSGCIMKWFDTKFDSLCPLCKSQFL